MRFVLLASALLTAAMGQDQVLPFLDAVPQTSFNCLERPYGYYSDVEANCQVFHICLDGAKWDFLCPNQTLFNQEYFVCDHPVNVECEAAEQFYFLNENFGKIEDDTESPVGTGVDI